MSKLSFIRSAALSCAAIALLSPAAMVGAESPAPKYPPTPSQIVAEAPASEWVSIAPSDLVVMQLVPDSKGRERRVVIQLMPAPLSQGWVCNIRTLVGARWYDGVSVNRVQDNYVVQWGDANGEDAGQAKALPAGLRTLPESAYLVEGDNLNAQPAPHKPYAKAAKTANCNDVDSNGQVDANLTDYDEDMSEADIAMADAAFASNEAAFITSEDGDENIPADLTGTKSDRFPEGWHERDGYAEWVEIYNGWPLGNFQMGHWENDKGEVGKAESEEFWFFNAEESKFWPVHCYGMVGVGRNLSPDTGTGAELYVVIGHAPRHLDRNIALVGRVIEGIEHLSSLPRGTGPLGFYESAEERVPIVSVRMGDETPGLPTYEYLGTGGDSFAAYANARANRQDDFFIRPAGGADICNIPVPIRRKA